MVHSWLTVTVQGGCGPYVSRVLFFTMKIPQNHLNKGKSKYVLSCRDVICVFMFMLDVLYCSKQRETKRREYPLVGSWCRVGLLAYAILYFVNSLKVLKSYKSTYINGLVTIILRLVEDIKNQALARWISRKNRDCFWYVPSLATKTRAQKRGTLTINQIRQICLSIPSAAQFQGILLDNWNNGQDRLGVLVRNYFSVRTILCSTGCCKLPR